MSATPPITAARSRCRASPVSARSTCFPRCSPTATAIAKAATPSWRRRSTVCRTPTSRRSPTSSLEIGRELPGVEPGQVLGELLYHELLDLLVELLAQRAQEFGWGNQHQLIEAVLD